MAGFGPARLGSNPSTPAKGVIQMDWNKADEKVDFILQLADDGERGLYFGYQSKEDLIWFLRVAVMRLKKSLGLKDYSPH